MDIAACPRCASLEVKVPTIGDGSLLGVTSTREAVCPDCDYQGPPLLFGEETDYLAFKAAVERGENPLDTEEDAPDETDELPDDLGVMGDDLREEAVRQREDVGPVRQRGAAVFASISVAFLFLSLTYFLFAMARTFLPLWPSIVGGTVLIVLEIWAYLRIAKRLWRGGGADAGP